MTLRTVLLSLQALLSAAEPDDPQDAIVASQYKDNYEMFVLTARHWTNAYANGKFFSISLQFFFPNSKNIGLNGLKEIACPQF